MYFIDCYVSKEEFFTLNANLEETLTDPDVDTDKDEFPTRIVISH